MPGLTNKRKGINRSVVTNYDDFTRQVARKPISWKSPPTEISPESKSEKPRKYDHSKEDFEIGKKEVEMAIDSLLEKYLDFTNDVSPKYWRTTGTHITDLKKMLEDLKRFEPISIEEKENEWVKEVRFKK